MAIEDDGDGRQQKKEDFQAEIAEIVEEDIEIFDALHE
jgi:hypothetical protein